MTRSLKDVVVPVSDGFVEQEGRLESARQALTRAAVLEMVCKDAISAGRGAELLGMRIDDFARLMGEHGMPWYGNDEEELASGLKTTPDCPPESL